MSDRDNLADGPRWGTFIREITGPGFDPVRIVWYGREDGPLIEFEDLKSLGVGGSHKETIRFRPRPPAGSVSLSDVIRGEYPGAEPLPD